MKKLSDMIEAVRYKLSSEEYILIDYDLFFNSDLGEYNRFTIDDKEELSDLKNVINGLRAFYDDMIIYVCAYSYETTDYKGVKNIYADCIWISSKDLNISTVIQSFYDFRYIEPNDISKLIDTDEYNQEHFYVFTNKGKVIDLKASNPNECFDNVVILYWD